MDYKSKYTGYQVEQLLDKAGTSLQSSDISKVATTGSYNDLSDKPTIPEEQVNADWNATSGKAQILNKPTIPSDDRVVHKTGEETISGAKTFTGGVNFLGSGDSNAVTLSTNTRINVNGTNKTVLGFGSGSFYINHADYNLLLRGKATRPTYNGADMALASDVNGKYTKPSTGIPKTDLASAVQTSLNKADTALQSYTEQYKGTVTGVKINGTTKNPSSGIVDLGTVITTHQSLKTINGESIVGNGDITISGGSSNANVQAVDTGDVLDDVNIEYATTAYVDNKVANISLTDYATITYVDGLVGDINSVLESIIGGASEEITFYIDDQSYVTPMKALPNMTWGEFINSEYANQNSMFTNFKLFDMGSYNSIQFYHEEATVDMTLYKDGSYNNVEDNEVIEDGKTYYAS